MANDRAYYSDEELARRRSERRRTLDLLENVPATHGVDRCVIVGVRRWLANAGIETVDDLQDGDRSAASLIDRIIEVLKQSRYDTTNPRTQNCLWVRLGLEQPIAPRSRHDELTR